MNFSSNKTNSMSEVRAPKARGNFLTCLLYFFSILCAACEIFRVQCLCQIKNQDNFKISGKSLILQDKTLISRQFQDRGNPVLGRFERQCMIFFCRKIYQGSETLRQYCAKTTQLEKKSSKSFEELVSSTRFLRQSLP